MIIYMLIKSHLRDVIQTPGVHLFEVPKVV
jgi:hypothetical protein